MARTHSSYAPEYRRQMFGDRFARVEGLGVSGGFGEPVEALFDIGGQSDRKHYRTPAMLDRYGVPGLADRPRARVRSSSRSCPPGRAGGGGRAIPCRPR